MGHDSLRGVLGLCRWWITLFVENQLIYPGYMVCDILDLWICSIYYAIHTLAFGRGYSANILRRKNKKICTKDPFTLILVYKRLLHSVSFPPETPKHQRREEKDSTFYKPSVPSSSRQSRDHAHHQARHAIRPIHHLLNGRSSDASRIILSKPVQPNPARTRPDQIGYIYSSVHPSILGLYPPPTNE